METHFRGLTPKSDKRGKLRRQKKRDRGNTCSLAASDKGSYSVPSEMVVRPFQSRGKYWSEQAKYP